MRFYKLISLVAFTLLLVFQNTVNTGCSKPPQDKPVDSTTNPPPPPPPPPDTISYVKKLDIFTSLYPTYGLKSYRSYFFKYDNHNRLTEVGIKNYSLVVYDTFTTRLEYIGNSKLPTRIIMPDLQRSSLPGPAYYDTTWFYYSADGRLQKDSTNELFYNTASGSFIRKPLYRNYAFPNVSTVKVDWFWTRSASQQPEFSRRDTVRLSSTGKPDFIKAQYVQDPAVGLGSYALANGFTFSEVVNPLSKLNISGTPYSLIYTNVKSELLGNNSHPMVYNSNGFADYLDFVSPVIPTLFYIGGYNKFYQMINSGSAAFYIEITPWVIRPSYPSEIRVTMGTSIAGDRYIYRYYY